jgi:hypothetical protein
LLTAAFVLTIAGCEFVATNPLPHGRRLVMTVDNQDVRPALLFVAAGAPDNVGVMGKPVGRATPATVPPGTVVDVAFDVPSETGWSIFVNPGPEHGPLLISDIDIPSGSGRLSIKISIGVGGVQSWSR